MTNYKTVIGRRPFRRPFPWFRPNGGLWWPVYQRFGLTKLVLCHRLIPQGLSELQYYYWCLTYNSPVIADFRTYESDYNTINGLIKTIWRMK